MSKELETIKYLLEQCINESIKKDLLDIKTALENYEELLKIEHKQNTINDFYPNTISMIKDLINLYETKVIDSLKSGELYTKDRLLEILGFASRYVLTFAYGGEFNETEKVSVNAKKLKAFDIIKKKRVCIELVKRESFKIYNFMINKKYYDELTQEEYKLLKEML